jgi:hypothetical protein
MVLYYSETSGSTKRREFLDFLGDDWFLKKASAEWS